MKYEQVYDFLINKIERELPDCLLYHDVWHTKGVIENAVLLAGDENITGDELILLKTAALFHDSGFLYTKTEHETYSCRLAGEYLPAYNYSPDQIEAVCELIMATRLPQSPHNRLSEILCDADLYYLGRTDYTDYAEKLYGEMLHTGNCLTVDEWRKKQIQFLTSHTYFTETAKKNQHQGKQNNLKKLKTQLTR